jgi:hypothetical protein
MPQLLLLLQREGALENDDSETFFEGNAPKPQGPGALPPDTSLFILSLDISTLPVLSSTVLYWQYSQTPATGLGHYCISTGQYSAQVLCPSTASAGPVLFSTAIPAYWYWRGHDAFSDSTAGWHRRLGVNEAATACAARGADGIGDSVEMSNFPSPSGA